MKRCKNNYFDRQSITLLYKGVPREIDIDMRSSTLYYEYGVKDNPNISDKEKKRYISKYRPTKPEFIRRIKRFCLFIILQSKKYSSNKKIWSACQKILYEVLICSLIMRKRAIGPH